MCIYLYMLCVYFPYLCIFVFFFVFTYCCELSRFRNVCCVVVRTLSLGLHGVTIPLNDERKLLALHNKGVELTT